MRYLIILALLAGLAGCKTYKNTCKNFLQPKVDTLAENIAVKCLCSSAKVHALFRKVPATICMTAKGQVRDMLAVSKRDGGPLSVLACELITEVVFSLSGQFAADKLECTMPLDQCLDDGTLKVFVYDNVCKYL